jgi:hypothetical protein
MAEIRVETDGQYLQDLKEILGNPKNPELISNALAALRWLADQARQGRQVVSEKEGSDIKRELALPILERMQRL